MSTVYPDGTVCLEGTKSVPKSYAPCCKVFHEHTRTCVYDIRYEWWPKSNHWVIAIVESAGGGGITMSYCLHCGARLMPQRQQRR